MKRYKPTYKAPKPYAQRQRLLHKRHRTKAATPANDDFDSFINGEVDEDMELNACSMYDCTGLIPAALKDRAEAEAYESLYPYIAPAAGNEENGE